MVSLSPAQLLVNDNFPGCIFFKIHVFKERQERERERERQRQKETFLSLVHYLSGYNGWGWTQLKPAAQNYIQIFNIEDIYAWAIFCCFLGCLSGELGQKKSSWDSN